MQSGSRVSGLTSDLSLEGCFICARRTLEVRARVRGTLPHEGQKVKMLAVVRVVKPHVGMCLEFWTLLNTFCSFVYWRGHCKSSPRPRSQAAFHLNRSGTVRTVNAGPPNRTVVGIGTSSSALPIGDIGNLFQRVRCHCPRTEISASKILPCPGLADHDFLSQQLL